MEAQKQEVELPDQVQMVVQAVALVLLMTSLGQRGLSTALPGGQQTPHEITTSQGNSGGTNGGFGIPNAGTYPSGGGGGAGGGGGNATALTVAGNGGTALDLDITGTTVYYAGGGGGAAYEASNLTGGGLGGGTSTASEKGVVEMEQKQQA